MTRKGEITQKWNELRKKVLVYLNLRKEIEQILEIDRSSYFANPDFLNSEYAVDFRYLKEGVKIQKNKEYCPRCECERCNIEEVD